MDSFDYWRLSDQLSIMQAALLMIGQDPSQCSDYIEGWQCEQRPEGYEAVKSAIVSWINSNRIEGGVNYKTEYNGNGSVYETDEIDFVTSWVNVASLRKQLNERGFVDGFFVSGKTQTLAYLDPSNEHYAPKLAAAVAAWEEVSSNPVLQSGKTPKQALEVWLRKHANDFGLTSPDGNPAKDAVEQIAKIANWKPQGGVAKTPTPGEASETRPTWGEPAKSGDFGDEFDPDIPF